MGVLNLGIRAPLALFIVLSLTHGCLGESQQIVLNGVTYKGQQKLADTSQEFYAFYGIPYARQPVGRFRFTRPDPIDRLSSWHLSNSEITKYYTTPWTKPKACAQIDPFTNMTDLETSAEDCLRIDLYIRKWVFDRAGERHPTAVLLEGFDFKQSVAHKLQPERGFLTEDSAFGILAVVHSRLGALGYLTTEDEDGPANLGLWDQHEALLFLKKSADILKINTDRITVLGFGAGGIAASIHMINGRNTEFFKTAVISGGSALGPDANVRFARERAIDFGSTVGCTSSNSRKLIDCLRGVKIEELLEKGADLRFIFGPVADRNHTSDQQKVYLRDWPEKLAKTATYDEVQSVIYGYPENAGTFRLFSMPSEANYNDFKPSLFGVLNKTASTKRTSRAVRATQDDQSLVKRIGMHLGPFQGYGDTLKTVSSSVKFVYFRNYTDQQVNENKTLFDELMCSALTDYMSFAPVVTMAHLHANAKLSQPRPNGLTGSGVFIYVRKSDPELSTFRRSLRLLNAQSTNRRILSTYMDDLLQFVGVEGTLQSNDADDTLRRMWAGTMKYLSDPQRSPLAFGNSYNPKDSTVTYIQEVTKSQRRDVQVPYKEPHRVFWSEFIPTIEDTLDVISAKSRQRHDTAVTYQRATWGVTAGLVVVLIVAIVLGILFWRQKATLSQRPFKTVPQTDPGRV